MVSSGRPALPYLRATIPESIAPTARWTFLIGRWHSTGVPCSIAPPALLDQRVVERRLQAVILRGERAAAHASRRRRAVEERRQVQPTGLPVVDAVAHPKAVDAADHLVDGAEAEPRHDLPQFLRDEEEELDHVLRRAGELPAQRRILGRDADGTGVQVALARHHAAHGDQGHGGEAELLRAEQRGHGDIAAGLELAVGLQDDAAPQVVHDEDLLRLRQPELPGNAGVAERGQGARTGAAAVA